MKVTDVITPPLNEWSIGGLFGTLRSRIVKSAIEALKKEGGAFAGEIDIKRVRDFIHGMGKDASRALMNDASIATEVTNAVNRVRMWNKATASVNSATKFITAAGFTASSARALYNYFTRMSEAEEMMATGQWTQDNYDAVRQQEMSVLLVTLAAGLPAVASRLLGVIGKIPFLGNVYKDVALLQGAALASYLTYLNTSDKTRQYLAAAAVYSLSDIPVVGPYISKLGIDLDVSRIVGAAGVQIADFFKPKLQSAVGMKPTGPTANAPIQQTAPQGQPTAAEPEVVPTAAQATNVAGWR